MNQKTRKAFSWTLVVCGLCIILYAIITHVGHKTAMDEYRWFNTRKVQHSRTFDTNATSQNVVKGTSILDRETRFGGFKLISDNATYAYAGYYDDRDDVHIKVIVLAPKEIKYGFTCIVSYPDGSVLNADGYIRYNFARVTPWTVNDTYRSGYIICPVPRQKGRPRHLLLFQRGVPLPKTNITVFPPSKTKNNITRCIREFDRNYSNVTQLVWNIELLRIFGVDRFIFYLWSQTEKVLEMLRSYEADGIVQLRNLTINQPLPALDKFIKSHIVWGQILAYHDCLFSEMFSAKYIIFHDVDEAIIPRKHKTLVELADDLFQVRNNRPIGSLRFRNTYFPLEKNKTNVDYPDKRLAFRYNIHPLLYMTHKFTSSSGVGPKVMVIPETVEEMFIHCVEKFKPGWREVPVDGTIARLRHYRYLNRLFHVHEASDYNMLAYSEQLISAVQGRFQTANIIP